MSLLKRIPTYAAIPKTSNVKDGYHDVSVACLARCVDFMAKWIEDKFGRSDSFETITYIGLSDLRGPVTLLAAIKPNLFKYYGRRDDILVLANGEKVNPIPLEQHIQGHPSVMGAIVIGNDRIQCALLVEPKEELHDEAGRVAFLDERWPGIEESNKFLPKAARITRNKTICALPEKPFARTGKGTFIRKVTEEEAYKNSIEILYSSSSPSHGKVDLEATGNIGELGAVWG